MTVRAGIAAVDFFSAGQLTIIQRISEKHLRGLMVLRDKERGASNKGWSEREETHVEKLDEGRTESI